MAFYQDFLNGPAPKNDKKGNIVKLISNLISFAFMPLAKVASKNAHCEKLIYTSLTQCLDKYNIQNHVRYQTIWKKEESAENTISNLDDCAIVMQGKIEHKNDFTFTTIKYYRKMYPKAAIILSTWEDENPDIISELEKIGVVCILNHYPLQNEYGRGNINLQLINTLAGIEKVLKDKKIKYVLKTRTDQRIYMPYFLQYFENLLSIFKIKEKQSALKKRIIFMNCEGASNVYYPFKLSDMLTFGEKNDIHKLYSIPLSTVSESEEIVLKDKTLFPSIMSLYAMDYKQGLTKEEIIKEIPNFNELVQYKMQTVAEMYIISNFIKKYINPFEVNENMDYLEIYWDFLKKYAVVIDKNAIDLFWPKYHFRYYISSLYQMSGQLDHARWMSMYVDYVNSKK